MQVEPEHGVAYGKPLTRTREPVAIVRELIRKGRVRFEGETIRIQNFELWYAPRHWEVPIYLSAVFPKGVALCGEVADGIILTRSTLRTAASVRVELAEAAHRVGRDPAKMEVRPCCLHRSAIRERRPLPRCDRASRSMQGFSRATTG